MDKKYIDKGLMPQKLINIDVESVEEALYYYEILCIIGFKILRKDKNNHI